MAIREYIGARYIPKYMGLWDNTQEYEALSVVDNGLGTSYISKIPTPAGTPLTNTTYWVISGSTNGAIIHLQDQIDKYLDAIVTPEMFGAEGDGTTDDSQAVQDAIDAGSIVLFKNRYLTKHVNITKPVILTGTGTIVLDTEGGTTYQKTAFYANENVVIKGLTFESIIYTAATPTERETPIVARDIELIKIEDCTFNSCGCTYLNNSGVNMWERNSAILTAVNVGNVEFIGNTIDGCVNEFLTVTPSNSLAPGAKTSVLFKNNTVQNVTGNSINLFAHNVRIEDNFFNNFNYAGSAFNLSGDSIIIDGDIFENCTLDSCYDCNEALLLHADMLTVTNVHARGTISKFLLASARLTNIINNDVQCSTFFLNDIGTRADSVIPTALQNTTVKTNGSVIIKNNQIEINNATANNPIFRVDCGFSHTSDDPIDDCGVWALFDISSNNMVWTITFQELSSKSIIHMLPMFKQANVCHNLFRSVNADGTGGADHKYMVNLNAGALNTNKFISLFTMLGNYMERGGATITETAPIYTNRTNKAVELLNIYYNKASGNFKISNGMSALNYTTLQTDTPV